MRQRGRALAFGRSTGHRERLLPSGVRVYRHFIWRTRPPTSARAASRQRDDDGNGLVQRSAVAPLAERGVAPAEHAAREREHAGVAGAGDDRLRPRRTWLLPPPGYRPARPRHHRLGRCPPARCRPARYQPRSPIRPTTAHALRPLLCAEDRLTRFPPATSASVVSRWVAPASSSSVCTFRPSRGARRSTSRAALGRMHRRPTI